MTESHVLALTELAARALLKALEKRGSLRGVVVHMQRQASHANAPVILTVRGEMGEKDTPPDFEIMDSLNRMWGLSPQAQMRGKSARGESRRIDRDPDSMEAFRRDRFEESRDERNRYLA